MIRWFLLGGFAVLAACGDSRETTQPDRKPGDLAVIGEGRRGELSVAMPKPLTDIAITEASQPGQPLVLIDPGHGGRDGGATGVDGTPEKRLTLAMAKELHDALAERARVRIALTRDDDSTLSLEQRAEIARGLSTDLFLSIHMDAAPNPDATGVTLYSLSDIASSTEAAARAGAERERVGTVVSDADDMTTRLLTDLALREQMKASADLARRVLRRAEGGVPLRPTPHQSADFVVLRLAQAPGLLVEAGYITNPIDAERLTTREGRAPLVEALARAIEADLATRTAN
ncbi:MAG: N-acetylmuramoyl-L-alanine amidase [Sphingomonas sp.]|nr:N-acetylmuramoyl-L-alanine amidase [Sphingomonas sp.]